MIYKIRHLTSYDFHLSVASAKLVLHVTPRDELGQRCIEHGLEISPRPVSVTLERDFYGNAVKVAAIETPHTELSIEATSIVEVTHGIPSSTSGQKWETVASEALSRRDLSGRPRRTFYFPALVLNCRPMSHDTRAIAFCRTVAFLMLLAN